MFPNAVKLFDFRGFEIRVDPSWLIIAALIVWSLATGYFPEAAPGLHDIDYLALATVAMLGLFAVLILHELSHAIVARRYGLAVGGITLFLFGGVAELQQEPESPASEFSIAIAGPATSFALAGIFAAIGAAAKSVHVSSGTVALLDYLAAINLVLAVFNLLPAFPLDGGRILRAALWRASGDLLDATRRASLAGRAAGYALVALGIAVLFSTRSVLGGLWPILLGLFLAGAAAATYQQMLTRRALSGRAVGDLMTRAVHVTGPDRTVSALVDEVMLRHGIGFVPVVVNGVALGYVDTAAVQGIDRDNWDATRVEDVFIPLSPEMVTTPAEPLDRLFRRIADTGRRKFIVTDAHGFAGVLTLSDLVAHIGVLRDLSPLHGGVPHRHV
jgi:Zn-dependent protease/predicted transcriptional regulator